MLNQPISVIWQTYGFAWTHYRHHKHHKLRRNKIVTIRQSKRKLYDRYDTFILNMYFKAMNLSRIKMIFWAFNFFIKILTFEIRRWWTLIKRKSGKPKKEYNHKHRGARWLSGRVSDSGARGPGFETYRRRVVSLSKTLYSPKVLVNYPGSDGSVPTWLKYCWLGR